MADFRITNKQTSVVSIVSDGPSVMKKLGKISHLITNSAMRMVCIWLCDVLYKNRSVTDIAGEDYDYDDDQDEKMYEEGYGIVIPATASNEVPVFNVEIEKVLRKVRKVVKDISKKSGKKRSLAEICVVGTKQGVVTCPGL